MHVPVMGHRMKFLKLMKNVQSEESTTTVRPLEDSSSEVEEAEKKECKYMDKQSCKQGSF